MSGSPSASASVAQESIAGLPADVVAQLAQEALRGTPEGSEAALATLSGLATASTGLRTAPGWYPDLIVARAYGLAESGLGVLRDLLFDTYAAAGVWGLGAGAVLVFAAFLLLPHRTSGEPATEAAPTPHQRARYGAAVTRAARLLARGGEPASVARASGLARDVLGVVSSRRLLTAALPGSDLTTLSADNARNRSRGLPAPGSRAATAARYAAAEASSGRIARGTLAPAVRSQSK